MNKMLPKLFYDQESDIVWIQIKEGEEAYFEEISPGTSVEFNSSGEVIGIEFLNATSYFKPHISATSVLSEARELPFIIEHENTIYPEKFVSKTQTNDLTLSKGFSHI